MIALDRRTLLGLAPLALAGWAKDNPYFGDTQPPLRQEVASSPTPFCCRWSALLKVN